jgi:hypothetical protein
MIDPKYIENINLDDSVASRVGAALAEALNLVRNSNHSDRWSLHLKWGTKTNAGLARTVIRIIEETK